MQAMAYHSYGSPDVLRLEQVQKPAPRDDQVLIRVRAASLNAADWRLLRASPFLVRFMGGGVIRPKHPILGSDVAGQVEAVGGKVTAFRPGDEVFGDLSPYGAGGFAEYVAAPERALVHKPANQSFEQAAAVPMAAVTALLGLRDAGEIKAGQKVLINGAAGGVGTFAVQIARAFGAEVTAVCSARNVEQARALGADHVIDYTREEFTRSGQRYDLILGVNGNIPLTAYKRALCPAGVYVMIGGSTRQLFEGLLLGPWLSRGGRQKFRVLSYKADAKDLAAVKELIEAGKISSVVERCYPLAELPEAIRYLEAGHARGKLVISVSS